MNVIISTRHHQVEIQFHHFFALIADEEICSKSYCKSLAIMHAVRCSIFITVLWCRVSYIWARWQPYICMVSGWWARLMQCDVQESFSIVFNEKLPAWWRPNSFTFAIDVHSEIRWAFRNEKQLYNTRNALDSVNSMNNKQCLTI